MSSETPRMRRLKADFAQMEDEIGKRGRLIKYEVVNQTPGMPPEQYIVTYNIRSIVGVDQANEPIYDSVHKVAIVLTEDYPNVAPQLRWRTKIWHPNIHHTTRDVCIDTTLWAPQRTLVDVVLMMADMLRYRNIHIDVNALPFPLDREAALWCQDYLSRHKLSEFPITDPVEPLYSEGELAAPKAPEPEAPKVPEKKSGITIKKASTQASVTEQQSPVQSVHTQSSIKFKPKDIGTTEVAAPAHSTSKLRIKPKSTDEG